MFFAISILVDSVFCYIQIERSSLPFRIQINNGHFDNGHLPKHPFYIKKISLSEIGNLLHKLTPSVRVNVNVRE